MMYFLKPVKFFPFNQAPFHSLDFLFARGRANLKLGGVDGSRICDVFHSDFHLVSLDFCYSLDIYKANPTKEKKIYFVLWMAGNIIFGRKPKEIAANQANWSNFPEESIVNRRIRVKDGVPYDRTRLYEWSFGVPTAPPRLYKQLS